MTKLGPDKIGEYKKIGINEGYDKWAATYDKESNPLIELEENITLSLIGNVKNQVVLDLGCGTGRYCKLLAKRGAKVIGIDPSTKMLEYAKRKITPDSQFELHLGKLEDVKFPSKYFDLIISALTLSHIPRLEPIIKEVSHILKPKGQLVISDFHPYWPISGHDYTEFIDETGQKYIIPEYTHLLEEYWHLFRKFSLSLEDLREPTIDDNLIKSFPALKDYKGTPLAIILKARKNSLTI